MLHYIEEMRTSHQNAEENLIQLEMELEEAREKLAQTAGSTGEATPNSLESQIKMIVELLNGASRNKTDIDGSLSRILGREFVSAGAVSHRLNKMEVLERIRGASVDVQRLKVDRLKAL